MQCGRILIWSVTALNQDRQGVPDSKACGCRWGFSREMDDAELASIIALAYTLVRAPINRYES